MREELIPVGGNVDLHLLRWSGTRRPVLLVHGLASNARMWEGVGEALARAGHEVAAVDLRGHGGSSKPAKGYDVATVVGEVAALLDHLGWREPVVAGQSWGGNLVLELAAAHPEAIGAIACVDGGWIDLQSRFADWTACRTALTPPALTGTPVATIEQWLRTRHPDWPESGIRGQLANFDVRADGTVAPWLTLTHHLLALEGLWNHRPAARYAQVACPVLLVPSTATDAEITGARAIPDDRVVWYRGADHDVHAQHPEAVAYWLGTLADSLG